MEYLRPIRWKEGMFLRPHHLQQFDFYQESREVALARSLEHYGWGFVRLEIDDESLNNYVLAFKALRAVLPDGTLVDVPGNARLLSRPLAKSTTDAGQPVDVFIGLKRIEERRPQAVAPEGAAPGQARFLIVNEDVYDLDGGKDPATIERLEYDLRVFLGEEPTHGYEVLPVARLAGTGDPARPIRPTLGFAPPSMVLAASAVLQGAARAVVERLATTLRDLGDVRSSEQASDLILYMALAGCYPVLKDMVDDGMVHPRWAYREMARVAGSLYFRDRSGRTFDEIPAYVHSDPGPVFEQLRKLINELSEIIFVRNWLRMPMERPIGDEFRVSIPADGRKPGARFFLQVMADDSTPRIKSFVQSAKISTPTRIDTLKKFVLPGVSTESQPGPPSELPPAHHGGSFFRLKVEEGNEWTTHVLPTGELSAFVLNAPQDLKFFLIVILPGG